MRDLAYTVQQISGLFAYYKGDGGWSTNMPDYGPNGLNAGMHGYYSSAPGQPAPGYLLDQYVPSWSMSLQTGHGHTTYAYCNMTSAHAALLNNHSWSLVIAGIKPHDMSVDRTWLGTGTSDIGLNVRINADGSLRVSGGAGTSASSAAGVIHRFVPHVIVASYDNVAHTITVWVGDWTGRWVKAIDAATISAITALVNASPIYLGTSSGAPNAADGFMGHLAIYAGHVITASEAAALFAASGYVDGVSSYTKSAGHRSAPINQAYPDGQTLDTNTVAAVAEFASKADSSAINGAGSFNYYQYTTSIFIVSGTFRKDSANWVTINGPTHYADQSEIMQFEDCPVPFSARPSLGFAPSGGSDAHACIWCPDTDEYWDMGVLTNLGTDEAPAWHAEYGGKINNFSLFTGSMGSHGATATGIPNVLGIPTVAELQNAIYNDVPIPHGLSAIMYDGLAAQVWPAARHDGSKVGSKVIEGQLYRLKHDSATSAAIGAMPHPTGKAMAQAAQQYGILVVDRNLFATLLQIESSQQYTAQGLNPYGVDPGGEPVLGGILNGQTYSVNTMTGFPWANLELLDYHAINAADTSQAIRSAPTGLTGAHTNVQITLAWPDDSLTSYWNVYNNVGGVYTKIATTYWPQYTIRSPISSMTLAVTAVNGGGESSRSADFTPPLPLRSRKRERMALG